MKGPWKVQSNPIGDTKLYRVYRVLDTSEPVHSGNMEFFGSHKQSREEAQFLANILNVIDTPINETRVCRQFNTQDEAEK